MIPQAKLVTLGVTFGSRRAGKTVQYQLLDHDLTILQAFTAVGVVEIGYGEYGVRLNFANLFSGYIRWKEVDDDIYATDAIYVVEDFITKISRILKIEQGRWKIISNQMIFYDEDGVTPFLTFNLKDAAGNPTELNPVERVI